MEDLLDFGFILIDKPKGIRSRDVTKAISKTLKRKAAHLGTLDPDATGLLPILLGRSTILTHFIMRQDKEYYVKARFKKNINEKKLRETINSFIGEIIQIPPEICAVARRKRKRKIYKIELLSIGEKEIEFNVACEAGTYITKLVEDIGKKMKNDGETVELRRIKLGKFDISECVQLEEFLKMDEKERLKLIRPIEEIVPFKKVWIDEGAVEPITLGVSLKVPGVSRLEKFKKGEFVSILNKEGKLIAIGKSVMDSDEILKSEKGEAVKVDRVIRKMEHLAGLAEW